VPPGFERDRDLTTINNAELNEQSMSLSVVNLRNGDSRAVFKNVNFDMQFNKRLKMFVHMENERNESNQVSSFIRLGTDLTDNYYEIEIKGLKATNPNEVNPQAPEPEKVWPLENEFDVSLDDLRRAKAERDKAGGYLTTPFQIETDDKRFWIRVVGRPDLSAVMSIMIGVRNPKFEKGSIVNNDEEPKSFSIWVNELRTNGYDQSSGYAAIGKLNLKLADLGSVTVSGSIKTFGFGSVMDKISQRERSTTSDINVQGSLQLDKFTKEKWGLRIPMYFNLGRSNISPNFNPLDPDMPLETTLASTNDPAKRELLKQIAEDNTTRKGINFTNVKKIKGATNTKNRVYDIENLSVSYSYSEVERTSPMIASYKQSSEKGAITYAFQPESKPIEPFKNSQVPLIRDFNLSPIPNSIAVSMDMDRSFVKTQMRNSDLTSKDVSPFFEKYWLMNRRYDVGWNLTKSIVLTYNALSNAIIDEPRGDLDTQIKQDSVLASLKRFGRTKGYDQRISGTYRIPFDKSKLLDWLSADYNYRSGYLFAANSYDIRDEENINFGNIIKNNREQTVSGRIDFVKLYNKVRYLKFANSPTPQRKNFTRNPGDFDELPSPPSVGVKSIARALMAIRGIQYSYTLSETTILPGFLPNVQFGGMNQRLNNAPGLAFTLGSQDPNIRFIAAEKGWLSRSLELNIPFVQTRTKRLDFRASIEPLKDFKIQLAANFSRSDNYSEFYRPRHADSAFVSQSPVRGGNFSMSFFSFGSSFDKNTKDNASPSFQRFSDYRKIIQDRITKENPEKNGNYNDKSQDVLIPAFFAAYAKRDPEKVSFSPFYSIPFPNWNVDYSGLVNSFPALKKNFSSINIKHNFTSIYSVGNFTSSLLYDQQFISFDSPLYPFAVISNAEGQYVPIYVMSVISMVEKFSPLIGIQVRTKDNSTFALEYNQERNVSLNLSNTSLADLTNRGLVIRFGTVKNNFRLPFKIGGQSVTLKNDLRFDINLTINDTRAILRKLDGETVPTSGNYNFQLNPKIIYKVNKKLDVTMYFDRMINDPLVTNSFRRATTAFGFKVRFDLSQ
jgi:cell surface protein SprA